MNSFIADSYNCIKIILPLCLLDLYFVLNNYDTLSVPLRALKYVSNNEERLYRNKYRNGWDGLVYFGRN